MPEFINILIGDPNKNQVLAIKRAKDDPVLGGMWALPGGGIGPGESVEETARREIMEETGAQLVWVAGEDAFRVFVHADGVDINLLVREGKINDNQLVVGEDVEEIGWIEPKLLVESLRQFGIPETEITKLTEYLQLKGYTI